MAKPTENPVADLLRARARPSRVIALTHLALTHLALTHLAAAALEDAARFRLTQTHLAVSSSDEPQAWWTRGFSANSGPMLLADLRTAGILQHFPATIR